MPSLSWQRQLSAALGLALVAAVLQLSVALPPARATSLGPFGCLPANGLSNGGPAQAAELYAGRLTIPGFRTVGIGTTGHLAWTTDPFRSLAWQKQFLSLDWLMSLTEWRGKNPGYLRRAEAFAADFAAHARPGTAPVAAAAWSGMYAGQRATVYACLRALDPRSGSARQALRDTGRWLSAPANDPGSWNQGVDAAIGLLAAGCASSTPTWADQARDRLVALSRSTIGSDGAIGEQAPGYGPYLWARLGVAAGRITSCLGSGDTATIQAQRAKLLAFLGWATEPSGTLSELGDSFRQPPPAPPREPEAGGTASEWAATAGASGTHPQALHALFAQAGYAFGRSSWDPFASSAYYAVRFGPGTALHGHQDHQQLMLSAYGEELVIDSGHSGYASGAYRDHLRSPQAHSVLVLPGVRFDPKAPTTLRRANTGQNAWQSYETSDTAYAGRVRTRDVLISLDTPFAVVYDRASRPTPGPIQQLWHLPSGARVARTAAGRVIATTPDARVTLSVLQPVLPGQRLPSTASAVVTGRTSPSYLGWVSHADGQRRAAPVVTVNRSGTGAAILTVLVPAPAGQPATATVARNTSGQTVVTVVVGGIRHDVLLSTTGFLTRLS